MPYSYEDGRYEHIFPTPPSTGDDVYLNDEISIDIERNLLTMATSRSGKGVCQIIPNLLRWSHSALVIDPKGEAAEATAEAREAMGQSVHVLDPFETCNVDDRFRAQLNLLDEIDPDSPHAFKQINALADGIIMRHDPKGGHWDGGAQEVLAGFIAHVISAYEKEDANLVSMRYLLTEPDAEAFGEIIDAMAKNKSCGRLPVTGAAKLTKTGSEAGHFLSGAVSNSKWIDDPFMQACLGQSTFKLSDLKYEPTTVYLVLPFDALADYGRFLRLFVRMALHHMMQKMPDGSLKGERCLFILDEFFSLGNISEISKSVGGMPGYNLHLWPFLQDHNQLVELYGRDGAGTFFANSDWSFFYGVNDPDTANYASKECGLVTESDLDVEIPEKPKHVIPKQYQKRSIRNLFSKVETKEYREFRINNGQEPRLAWWEHGPTPRKERHRRADQHEHHKIEQENIQSQYQDEMNEYGHAKAVVGHPRIQPTDIMELTARSASRKVADAALCFSQGSAYAMPLTPFFEVSAPPVTRVERKFERPAEPEYEDEIEEDYEEEELMSGEQPLGNPSLESINLKRLPAKSKYVDWYGENEDNTGPDPSDLRRSLLMKGIEILTDEETKEPVIVDGFVQCIYSADMDLVFGWLKLD